MKSIPLFMLLSLVLSGLNSHLIAQWQQRAIVNQNVHAVLSNGGFVYAGSDSGCYLSTDNGVTWTRRSNGLPTSPSFFVKTFAVQGSNLFAGTNGGGGAYLTTDNGGTWNATNAGLGSTAVHALVFDNNSLIAGTLNGGVFESTDNGLSWHDLNNGITSLAVHALLVAPGRLFAGSDGGVFVSSNSGGNWSLPAGSPLNVRGLAALGSTIFAATRFDGIFKSTDDGTTWTADTAGMASLDVRVVIEHNGNLFAGTGSSGVYLSTDAGTTWSQINTGLTAVSILSLGTNTTTLFAGTQVGGIWTRPLSEVVSVGEHRIAIPTRFALEQNYPNPFNPTTTVKYSIPSTNHVVLKIFNVLGQDIATLVDRIQSAGDYTITVDASSFPTGIYFYRLETQGQSLAKTMVLVK